MTHTRTALIIGGGIAGPVAAMALQKVGIDPVVYEARPAEAHATGVFLTLASNGIDALRVLDADKAVLERGFPTPGITLRSGTGKRLGHSRTGRPLADGTTSHTIRRADLYRALHDEADSRGVLMRHGRRLVAAHETDDGVRAVFDDGSEAIGDVLVGCDGVHSTVRGIIDPAAPAPTYTGLIGTGGYASGVPLTIQPGSFEMIFGRRAFFGYALAPDGAWWFANVPRHDQPTRGQLEGTDAEAWRRRLVELFADDAGSAIPLIQATPQIMAMSPMHTIPHLPRWHSRRMVVIGDAAHAPSPSSGQGASLAIEDGVVLARCLRDLSNPQAAFDRFEADRRPRVEGIIRWAARINNNKAAGPVARVFRDAMLPTILKMTANSKALEEMYGYHIDFDAPIPVSSGDGQPA